MEYKSTIKSIPYLYKETKKAAMLMKNGLTISEIKNKAIEENIFQLEGEARKKEFAAYITTRLNAIDEFIIDNILEGTVETSKILVLYSIVKTDRLFFEFMNEVYKEKLLLRDYSLKDKDLAAFFENKIEQSEKVASWKEKTIKDIKSAFVKILLECGLIEGQKGDRKIKTPILERHIEDHICKIGDRIYINAIVGDSE